MRIGIAIAVLAGVVHFDRNPGQPLDHEFAGQPGMPTGAAGGDVDLLQLAEFVVGDLHLIQENPARVQRNAPHGGIAHGSRLLVDFLEHEVLEAALLRHDRVPGDVLHLAGDGVSVEIGYLHAVRRDDGEIAVGHEEQVARVIQDGRHIGGDKVFIFAQADHRRRTIARGHDLVGLVDRDDREREDARQLLHGLADGLFQRRPLAVGAFQEVFLDQVGDDLGVGFRRKGVALLA